MTSFLRSFCYSHPASSHEVEVMEETTNCPICLESISLKTEKDVVRGICSDSSHKHNGPIHISCLRLYITSKVCGAMAWACPIISCPYQHSGNTQKILKFDEWKNIVDDSIRNKYCGLASSLLSILCAGCHLVKSVFVESNNSLKLKAQNILSSSINKSHISIGEFNKTLEAFEYGDISVEGIYQFLCQTLFPQLLTDLKSRGWYIFNAILQMISNPERRSNLYLRYLRDFPVVATPCCNKYHCFRCKTKDTHAGKSCEENSARLDSTIINCPGCGIAISKGDGCNTIACICGRQFSWAQEKELLIRSNSFLSIFPENTADSCVEVLYGLLPGNIEHAKAWKQLNIRHANAAFLRKWKTDYPLCPTQAAVTLNSLCCSEGFMIARDIWLTAHPAEAESCKKINIAAKSIPFQAMAGSTPIPDFAVNMLIQPLNSTDLGISLQGSLSIWLDSNKTEYSCAKTSFNFRCLKQLLYLYGSKPLNHFHTTKLSLCSIVYKFDNENSNKDLTFSDDKTSVWRTGSVSCYPAAFAELTGPVCTMTVILERAPRGSNWMTIGICEKGALALSSSDGVGRTRRTWGVCDDRSTSSTTQAAFMASGSAQKSFRKLQERDVIKITADIEAGWVEFIINENEFLCRMLLTFPQNRHFSEYIFGLTIANNHKVSLIASEIIDNDRLSHNQLSMYNSATTYIKRLSHETDGGYDHFKDLEFVNMIKDSYSLRNHSFVSSIINPKYNVIPSFCPEGFQAISNISWNQYVGALIWQQHINKANDFANSSFLADSFLKEHLGSATMIAAAVFHGDIADDNDMKRRAEAFMKTHPELMNEWYEYNSKLLEPLVDLNHISKECRCVPRHRNCPKLI